jgi:hypothetical protein
MASEPKQDLYGPIIGNRRWHGGYGWEMLIAGEWRSVNPPTEGTLMLLDAELARGREAVEVLRECEWEGLKVSEDVFDTCPLCEGRRTIAGHAPDCRLAKVIGVIRE